MASTYTANIGIEKIGSGEQTGTWGTTTNTNFDIIDRAINGVVAISLSSTSHTLTTTDGTLSEGGHKLLSFSGSPGGTCTVTISPNDQDKVYFVKNGTDQTLSFTQGSGANATVSSGSNAIIFADGAGSGAAVAELSLATQAGVDIGATSAEIGDVFIADDKAIKFGSDQDVQIEYDEDGTDTLLISGGDVTIADDKKLNFGTDKDTSIEYDEDGTNKMIISGNVTFADGSTDVDIASHDTTNGLKLGGTLVSATAAELNIMDGVTATTSELNIMDGVTATTSELNIMDGVTATTSELNIMDGVTATTSELNHTDGVTSNIQTQLDAKQGTTTLPLITFTETATNTFQVNVGGITVVKAYGSLGSQPGVQKTAGNTSGASDFQGFISGGSPSVYQSINGGNTNSTLMNANGASGGTFRSLSVGDGSGPCLIQRIS